MQAMLMNLVMFFVYGTCFYSFVVLFVCCLSADVQTPLWLDTYTLVATITVAFYIIKSFFIKNKKLVKVNYNALACIILVTNLLALLIYNPNLALYVFTWFISLLTGAYFNQ
ncbi:MAG: hypothetical protein E7016_02295 [Alphaproteobacteria bacterium]|nr:hypothetical protein [Alphaproteobacteria bacterium]